MKKELRALVTAILLAISLAGGALVQSAPLSAINGQNEPKSHQNLVREVRHQLVMLPYYSVFDNLTYRVDGDKIVLEGQVVRPSLKSDAEAAVKSIEGISGVENNIEILPTSPNDDRIRRAVYRAIYGSAGLDRYSLQAVPSIHIIVKNGNVALEGVADTDADKNLAGIRSNGVTGVFSVKNNLVVTAGK